MPRQWICTCGIKNDLEDQVCYVCGGETTVKAKEPKPIKKTSKSREVQVQEYLRKVTKWKKGKCCVMCDWEGKKNTDITPHHQQGKEGELLNDFTKIIPLCIKHHNWATEHSAEAIKLGISLPRNSKQEIE